VDCGLCVDVCPTGIDIRDGLQLECIACTQCIDACNGVMGRIGRAPNLIGYRALEVPERGRGARLLRPRVVVYGGLLAAAVTAFAVALHARSPFDFAVERNRSALSQALPDGRVGNAYTLHVENRAREPRAYWIRLEGARHFELLAGANPIAIPAASVYEARVFVVAPRDGQRGAAEPVRFVLEDAERPGRSVARDTTFVDLSAAPAGTPP
jgi:cytochrome c oxidase accessory protein FixG